MKQECFTCKWWDRKPNWEKERITHKYARKCLFPAPELPVLPEAVTRAYSWHWPPHRNYVDGTAGINCPCWERRDNGKSTLVSGRESQTGEG